MSAGAEVGVEVGLSAAGNASGTAAPDSHGSACEASTPAAAAVAAAIATATAPSIRQRRRRGGEPLPPAMADREEREGKEMRGDARLVERDEGGVLLLEYSDASMGAGLSVSE